MLVLQVVFPNIAPGGLDFVTIACITKSAITEDNAAKLQIKLATLDIAFAEVYTLLEHAGWYLCKISAHVEKLREEIDAC